MVAGEVGFLLLILFDGTLMSSPLTQAMLTHATSASTTFLGKKKRERTGKTNLYE